MPSPYDELVMLVEDSAYTRDRVSPRSGAKNEIRFSQASHGHRCDHNATDRSRSFGENFSWEMIKRRHFHVPLNDRKAFFFDRCPAGNDPRRGEIGGGW